MVTAPRHTLSWREASGQWGHHRLQGLAGGFPHGLSASSGGVFMFGSSLGASGKSLFLCFHTCQRGPWERG